MFFSKSMKLVMVLMVFLMVAHHGINAKETINAVVAKDGSGNYAKISDAVKAAPNYSRTRYNIRIKAGVYWELVRVPKEKQNLGFIGDGADVTIIKGNRGRGFSMVQTPTVAIQGAYFVAKYISFNNSAGCGNYGDEGPATALRNSATFSAFYMCNFNGYQDTLFADQGYQFFKNCDIYGTVDFIYGGAAAVFQGCNIYIHNRPKYKTTITAQSAAEGTTAKTGFSFHKCNVKRANDFDDKSTPKSYLGRPYSDMSTVVFMESFLDYIVDPEGWLPWPQRTKTSKVFYGEYNNTGYGANTKYRVKWANPGKLSHAKAQQFTVRNFLPGQKWLWEAGIPYQLDLDH